jgi:hypothetical protein
LNWVWHQGRQPASLISRACRRLLMRGRVVPGVFLGPGLLRVQESVGQANQTDMMMPTQPMAALMMIQAQLLFQLPVVQLDAPAGLGHAHHALQPGQGCLKVHQPVLDGLWCALGPFHQQPLGHPLRVFLLAPAMGCPDLDEAKPRTLSLSKPTTFRTNRRCTSSTAQGLCPTNCRSACTSAPGRREAIGPTDLRSPSTNHACTYTGAQWRRSRHPMGSVRSHRKHSKRVSSAFNPRGVMSPNTSDPAHLPGELDRVLLGGKLRYDLSSSIAVGTKTLGLGAVVRGGWRHTDTR